MRYLLLGLVGLSVFLLYTLTLATGNANKMGDYFWLFVAVNGSLLLILVFVIFGQTWTIRRDIRTNIFGAKLTKKLMLAFSVVTILPSLFLLLVSTQFISHSIGSWFGKTIETSFDNGIRLGQAILDERIQKSKADAIQTQALLNQYFDADGVDMQLLSINLEEIKTVYRASNVLIYDESLKKVLVQTKGGTNIAMTALTRESLEDMKKEGWASSIERVDNDLYTRIVLPLKGKTHKEKYILLFEQTVPQNIARDALALENSRAEYNQLAYAKEAMQTTYLMTLVIASLLSISLSLICALFFSRRFTAPLLALSAGTKAVAQGDFSQRSPIFRGDELGILTSSFNRMTEQLAEAQKKQVASKTYLENVLESLSAGVVAFDPDNKIRMVNFSAESILDLQFDELMDTPWSQWPQKWPKTRSFIHAVQTIVDAQDNKGGIQVEYTNGDTMQVLLGKAVSLPEHVGGGYMLVLDDVTELVHAQKEAAWGEVAKRLAHEIRNPLTPIQLSAERLAMKLSSKLSEQDAGMLIRSTDTIVKQVGALKGMVEAFRNYARSPSTNMQKININEILDEVLVLYESYACKITLNLSRISLYVDADVAMMRQVFHNLLQNAQDAVAGQENPQINVCSLAKEDKAVIIIEDNGTGFDVQMLQKAFEPYITSKATGTGLGLAVVKKIIVEHKGEIVVGNGEEGGAQITIALPLLET